jgi:hypothetical protein
MLDHLFNRSFLSSFILTFLLYQKKIIINKVSYLSFFFSNINVVIFFLFLFNRDKYNPIISNEFRLFILQNKKKWLKKKETTSKDFIAVECFVNHAAYTLSNILISQFLHSMYNYQRLGIVRKGDIKSEIIYRSFGIKNFVYYKNLNFYEQIVYISKAIILLNNIKTISQLCGLKYKSIDVGLFAYDTYIRYSGNPTAKKINYTIVLNFAEAIYSCDFFLNIVNNFSIKKLVQSETQFLPLNILFQTSLRNNIEVFSRFGANYFTIRRYTNFTQRYSFRGSFSQILFNKVLQNFKNYGISQFKNFLSRKIKKKEFGVDVRTKGFRNSKKPIFLKKKEIKNLFGWNNDNKKVIVIFLSHLIDANFPNGRRVNFQDTYCWTEFILDHISKLNKVNWIIKDHPSHKYYKVKNNFNTKIDYLQKKYKHIRLFSDRYSSDSLIKVADGIVTSNGSTGIEYPALGTKSIVTEKSYYSNLDFVKVISNKKQILEILKKIHLTGKLKKDLVDKYRIYLFIREILMKTQCNLIPSHIISRNINEDKFWRDLRTKIKKFNILDDEFYKMFAKQIKYNSRHTLNYNIINFKDTQFGDFDDK